MIGLKNINRSSGKALQNKINYSLPGKIALFMLSVFAVVVLTTSSAYATIDNQKFNLNNLNDDNLLSMNAISADELREDGLSTYNYADNQVSTRNSSNETSLPSSFDMRDKGWISKVRFQNPWGSCWAFAIIAAAEASIQHDLVEGGQSVDDVNMSEHHLGWFAKSCLPETGDYNGQNGEGYHTDNPGYRMQEGFPYYGATSFSSGLGIVDEQSYPYIGKNRWVQGSDGKIYESKEACEAAGVTPICYAINDDWSIDESERFSQIYPLKESNAISDFMVKDATGNYILDQSALNNAKNEIYNGRALAMIYKDDQATEPGTGTYMNVIGTDPSQKIFNHYTWEKVAGDHSVCIVGWDDNYDKSNFSIDPIEKDNKGNVVYQLTGRDLENDASGKPYYCNKNGDQFYVDTKNKEWVTKTEKTDQSGNYIYKLTENKLNNDDTGYPLIPGKNEQLPGLPQDKTNPIIKIAHTGTTHTPADNGAWIVKNSWGAASQDFPDHYVWGNNGEGYFYLSYYDLTTTFLESYDFAVSDEEKELYESDTCYQYDYMDALGIMGDQTSDFPTYMSNTYTAKESCSIKSLSSATGKPESTVNYKIYLLDENSTNPTDGTLATEETAKYNLAGYHRINLTNPVKVDKGQKYSIVVEESIDVVSNDNTSKNWCYTSGANKKYLDPSDEKKYTQAVVNNGESTLGISDENGNISWRDWKDYTEDTTSPVGKMLNKGGLVADNFAIKAFADYTEYSEHSITCTASVGGSLYADQTKASKGQIVTLNAVAETGYYLSSLTVTDANGNSIPVANNQFTMPDSDVSAYATFSAGDDPSQVTPSSDDSSDDNSSNASTITDNNSNSATTGDNTSTYAIFLITLLLIASASVAYSRRHN